MIARLGPKEIDKIFLCKCRDKVQTHDQGMGSRNWPIYLLSHSAVNLQ